MRPKFVAGNWKMNGSFESNHMLLTALVTQGGDLPEGSVGVFPPSPYIAQCSSMLDGTPWAWGAQDVSCHESGAFTGEVAASMLVDLGCAYVIVGHSERRALHGESSELVARKALAAHRAGIRPIVCVGETLAERESGVTEAVIGGQVDALMDVAGEAVCAAALIAYEPVWAIGTGRTASPDQAQEVHAFIRGRVGERFPAIGPGMPILYGGSVKASNARALFEMPDVDGGLVGGASLVAHEFLEICRAAQGAGQVG